MKKSKSEVAKRPVGKPPKVLDEALLFKLGQTMLTNTSIAKILECSHDLLETKYAVLLHKAREQRKQNLVEAMWSKALEDKNTTMQIWLSKQHLGYRDSFPDEAPNTIINIQVNEVP